MNAEAGKKEGEGFWQEWPSAVTNEGLKALGLARRLAGDADEEVSLRHLFSGLLGVEQGPRSERLSVPVSRPGLFGSERPLDNQGSTRDRTHRRRCGTSSNERCENPSPPDTGSKAPDTSSLASLGPKKAWNYSGSSGSSRTCCGITSWPPLPTTPKSARCGQSHRRCDASPNRWPPLPTFIPSRVRCREPTQRPRS